MSRIHFATLYLGRDPHVVFHPSCDSEAHAAAADLPIHAVGRSHAKKRQAIYDPANVTLMWSMLRKTGHWPCSGCRSGKCDVVWDDAWVQSIGMAKYETVPEWEKIFERMADFGFQIFKDAPSVPLSEHEAVLGLVPPYDHDQVVRAYRAAAMRAHPDRPGGSTIAMQRVNAAKAAMDAALL